MPRETHKQKKTKPALLIKTVALTADEAAFLRRASEETSDVVGRKVSASAIVRACVQWIATQERTFVYNNIVPLVEREMSLLRWGSVKGS